MNLLLLNISKMDPVNYFELNTHGLCLVCLSADKPLHKVSSSLKLLLRYLNINALRLCNFSGQFLEKMDALEDAGLKVTLCQDCNLTVNKFGKLFQSLEYVRMQLDTVLKTLHSRMDAARGDKQVEFERRLRSRNLSDMFNASVVDNLRQETFKKCTAKVESLIPRVSILSRDQSKLLQLAKKRIPGPKSRTHRPSPLLQQLLNKPIDKPVAIDNQPDLKPTPVMEATPEEFVVKVEPIPIPFDLDLGQESHSVDFEIDLPPSPPPAKPFPCEYCPKSFDHEAGLFGHLHVHKNRVQTGNKSSKKVKKKPGPKPTSGFPLKRRLKCSICKQLLTSQLRLKTHMNLCHGREMSIPDRKSFSCEICEAVFPMRSSITTHKLAKHARVVYAKLLPEEISEEHLEEAVKTLLEGHKPIFDPKLKKTNSYGCQFCGNVLPHPSHLKLHILRAHKPEVVEAAKRVVVDGGRLGLYDDLSEGEFEPEMPTLLPSQVEVVMQVEEEDVDGIEGEEETMEEEDEIEPQPIVLSSVYTLNGGGGGALEVTQGFDRNVDPLMED